MEHTGPAAPESLLFRLPVQISLQDAFLPGTILYIVNVDILLVSS